MKDVRQIMQVEDQTSIHDYPSHRQTLHRSQDQHAGAYCPDDLQHMRATIEINI